jgi:large subunit ribosomal protein LP1
MAAQDDKDLQACVFAALILHDGGVPTTGDRIKIIVDASNNTDVQLVYCNLIAKFLQNKDVSELFTNIQTGQQVQGAREEEWDLVSEHTDGDGDSGMDVCDKFDSSDDEMCGLLFSD